MNALRALLADRRRSQRGSVLSGVLIITAFLAILSGALMTELSTNFLLSNALVNRVSTQATVNSAVELALDQLANTPISAGCPATATVTVNGRTAEPSYLSCWPTVRRGEPRFNPLSSGAYNLDGTHAASGLNAYIVGDSGGTVHDYGFGQTTGWSLALGGSITAPATAMVDPSGPPDVSILVPVSHPTTAASGCDSSQTCVALLSGLPGVKPSLKCYMQANTAVVSAPAAGRNFPNLAYFGDAVGNVFAYVATEDGDCALQASAPTTDGDDGVLAGPLVMPGPGKKSGSDAVYVVVGDSVASYLDYYTYSVDAKTGPALTEVSSLPLPAPSAEGMAFDGTSLPVRLAITFAGGRVALVRIQTDFTMSVIANTSLGTSISDSPFWCHCPGSADVIGVGGRNGALYLLDPSLNTLAALPAGGPAISTTPQSDGLGDWLFGADDGYLYEAQQPRGQFAMTVVTRFGPMGGAVSSGAQVGGCPAGLCAYLGSGTNDYIVQLDARDAVITSCISTAPPACSGANPRLWASVEVGAAGSPSTVHVQGWSYYSP
jgi:hypothetical protein